MKYKLLVAEEKLTERHALVDTLTSRMGKMITVYEAQNGTDALDLFRRVSPQIVLLDLDMPDPSGLRVAKQIREHSRSCAILLCSASEDFVDAREAIAIHALDYLQKPFDADRLIHAVEEAIQYNARFAALPQKSQGLIPTPTDMTRLSLVREDILSYIESHYMEELSMKNVARVMNYTDAYFCKLFKLCFHVNFTAFLHEYRITKAKDMMKNPRIPVKDVSISCGYPDSNYFARVFKRVTGQTPSAYRLQIMEHSLRD